MCNIIIKVIEATRSKEIDNPDHLHTPLRRQRSIESTGTVLTNSCASGSRRASQQPRRRPDIAGAGRLHPRMISREVILNIGTIVIHYDVMCEVLW